jgi:hypothetical protein
LYASLTQNANGLFRIMPTASCLKLKDTERPPGAGGTDSLTHNKSHPEMRDNGTDFHGALTPDLKLGRGFEEMDIPDSFLTLHKERCT